jgi:hypothetical protein
MNYTLNQNNNGINELTIPTNTQWGTICFAWENTNIDFVTALNSKGIDAFIDLLVINPNNAYQIFVGA